jgi:hypothetical protein
MVDFRCDLDLCITVQPLLLKTPFEDLVRLMKEMLLKVKPSIKQQGRENAKQSERFMAERPEETEHILNLWARTVVVPEQTRKEQDSAFSSGVLREEEDVTLDMFNPWTDSNVKGRMSEMMLMEDGTLVPMEHTYTPPDNGSYSRASNINDGLEFQQTMPPGRRRNVPDRAQRSLSNARPRPGIQPLSESYVDDLDPLDKEVQQQSMPPRQPIHPPGYENAKPPAEDDFDWLFGDDPNESSKGKDESNEKAVEEHSETLPLDWPPRKSS